ncbi:hypothetical protein GCM10027043_34680 [Ferruginibacter profundus]
MIVISILFPSLFAYINHDIKPWTLATDILVTSGVMAFLAFFIYGTIWLWGKIQLPGLTYWVRQLAELIIIFAGSFYFLYAVYMVTRDNYKSPSELFRQMQFRLNISVNLLGALFIYILEKSFALYELMLIKSAQAEKLQEEYSQVRLLALKSQVNPHFLFNSLSVLSSLVHSDAETSEKFIIQLSKAYRYILEQKDAALISLKEELSFLEAYFFLLQIRFGKKIELKKNISVEPEIFQLPPLTLQLLVENAVKHNKMSVAEPLIIEISAHDKAIEVKNNFNPREAEERSTGIGLDNITKRVAYVTNDPVQVIQNDNWFNVIIPLNKPA